MRFIVPRLAIVAAYVAMCLAFVTERTSANIITIDATDSGWYSSVGYHDSTNKNYIAGFAAPTSYNDYFVFDLSSIQAPIFSAEIKLYMPTANLDGYNGYVGQPSVFSLYQVVVPVNNLMQDQSGISGQVIFTDLADGTLLGSTTLSTADNGTVVSIGLNSDAMAVLNAGIGGLVAFGGTLATLGTSDHYAFGATGELSTRQMIVATVPEPVTVVQLSIGLSALLIHARRRRLLRA